MSGEEDNRDRGRSASSLLSVNQSRSSDNSEKQQNTKRNNSIIPTIIITTANNAPSAPVHVEDDIEQPSPFDTIPDPASWLGRVQRAPSFFPSSVGGTQPEEERNDEVRKRAFSFSPEAPVNAPVVLVWKDLTVRTRTQPPKTLLHNINGSITGGFWAIMGSSGGGKTTLLSTVSLRLDQSKMETTGTIHLNGHEYDTGILKAMSAYVLQDDLLHPELTVKETISYHADLRLAGKMSESDRHQRQVDVIALMGIGHIQDVIIGDTRRKGISGGERKRVCVAVELLTAPKLLFLDEPTSGLDSTTALTVCKALKDLSTDGICTVICTIHQPQRKIFDLFDNLILMKKGQIVYQGACQKSLLFLEMIGKPCPVECNPADFLIDAISANDDMENASVDESRRTLPVDLNLGEHKIHYESNVVNCATWMRQLWVLFVRCGTQYIRRKDIILMNLFLTVVISIFISCGIWHQIGVGQDSIAKRGPSLFFASVCQGIVAALQTISSFPMERAIILRERAAGAYTVSAYFIARSCVDFLTTAWGTTIFCAIVYPTIGYQAGADKFFVYWMFMMLNTNAALALATMVSCLCVSLELSTITLSLVLEVTRLYGGFFTSPKQLTSGGYDGWKFADALSYLKYSFVGTAVNEMSGLRYTGCSDTGSAAGTCVQTGEQTMAKMGYDQYTVGFCAGILVVYIFGARLVAYLALRFFKK